VELSRNFALFFHNERMREFLFPEEVYEYIKGLQGFEDYTEEQLYQDLDQLVKWNNLVAIQETNRARTIEEFKKKCFRYQCTPSAPTYPLSEERLEKLSKITEVELVSVAEKMLRIGKAGYQEALVKQMYLDIKAQIDQL